VNVVDVERWCFEKSLPCVFAVDPGISTGLAVAWVDPDALFDPGRKVNSAIVAWGCTTLRGSENEQLDVIRKQISLLSAYGAVGVVTEDFVPRRLDQTRDFLSPVRMNAVMEYMLFRGIAPASLPGVPVDASLFAVLERLSRGVKKAGKVPAGSDGAFQSYGTGAKRGKSPQFHTDSLKIGQNSRANGVSNGAKSVKEVREFQKNLAKFAKSTEEIGPKSAYLLEKVRENVDKKGDSDVVMIQRVLLRQSPNDAKNVINDGRLRIWNMYTPGPDHARDATRHVLLWLRKMKAAGWETFKEMHGVGKTP
jgi:hypothetical protein